MNFASFGYGLAGALQGFQQTTGLINGIRNNVNQNEIRKQTKAGMKSAEADRQNDINGLISQTDDANGNPTGFQVGKHTFKDQQSAEDYASGQVGSAMDYFNQKYAPGIQQTYMEQGNPEAAEQWQQFSQDQSTQTGTKFLARANLARLMGDTNGMVSNIMSAVNSSPGAAGYKITGATPVTDNQGNVTSYNLDVTQPDGTTSQRAIDGGADGIWSLGSAFMSPQTQYDHWVAQKTAAAKVAGDAAIANLKGANNQAVAAINANARTGAAGITAGGRVQTQKMREDGANTRLQMAEGDKDDAPATNARSKLSVLQNNGVTPTDEDVRSAAGIATPRPGKAGPGPGGTFDTLLKSAATNNVSGGPLDMTSIKQQAIDANNARTAVTAASPGGANGLPQPGSDGTTPTAGPAQGLPQELKATDPSPPLYDPSTGTTTNGDDDGDQENN